MSKGSKQRPTDHKKLEQNWPWPDPFEQRLAMKREEERRGRSEKQPVLAPIGK